MAARLLLLDSNVIIDYSAADRGVLTLVWRHVGLIHIPSVLLKEVGDLDQSECDRLGLVVVEPAVELLAAAGKRRPGLSFNDHVCLLAAKAAGWTCVTNDNRLRRECKVEKVAVLWGLEMMVPLVAGRHLSVSAARGVAEAIHAANPMYVTKEIVRQFEKRITKAAGGRKE